MRGFGVSRDESFGNTKTKTLDLLQLIWLRIVRSHGAQSIYNERRSDLGPGRENVVNLDSVLPEQALRASAGDFGKPLGIVRPDIGGSHIGQVNLAPSNLDSRLDFLADLEIHVCVEHKALID